MKTRKEIIKYLNLKLESYKKSNKIMMGKLNESFNYHINWIGEDIYKNNIMIESIEGLIHYLNECNKSDEEITKDIEGNIKSNMDSILLFLDNKRSASIRGIMESVEQVAKRDINIIYKNILQGLNGKQ